MDALAAFGSLIITEGANSATLVTAEAAANAPEVQVRTAWTADDQRAADAVFATDSADPAKSPAFALLVTTACASALKGVVLDEGARQEQPEDEEEEPKKKPKEQEAV